MLNPFPASRRLVLGFRRYVWQRRLQHDLRETVARLHHLKRALRPGQRLVCIGLIEHFGDIVACEPVARYVRAQNPDACLVWLVRPAYRELVAFHPALDETLPVSCISEYTLLIASGAADEFIDLHVNLRPCSRLGSIHHKRSGDRSIDSSNYLAHGSLLEAFCKSAGLPPLVDGPRLHLPLLVRAQGDTIAPKEPFIVVHSRSNESSRDWQTVRWVELIKSLSAETKITFVEVGLRSQLAGHVPDLLNLCGRLSLVQLAEVIRRSTGFLGIESGPAHMANALERPAVILMGRYRTFERYMPYTGFLRARASEMIIQWDGPVASIPIEAVAGRFRRVFAADRTVAFVD